MPLEKFFSSPRRILFAGVFASAGLTLLIAALAPRLASIEHLPDEGPSWYYWQLTEPSFWAQITAWGFYLLHQLFFWGLIYRAQKERPHYNEEPQRLNLIALGGNLFFILLHLLQTHIWYDGLARDVSIWSALASVAILLILVLIMESPRRGLFFGYRAGVPATSANFLKKYHGYYFSWAIVYTFWYHPMEATLGHLLGFLYMFFLIFQGSLFFTTAHLNRWWRVFLEVFVVFHGTLVAIELNQSTWAMFLFGFGAIFIITQMHGLGLSSVMRRLLALIYLITAGFVYHKRGFEHIHEIFRIPVVDYTGVYLSAWLIYFAVRIKRELLKKFAKKTRIGAGDETIKNFDFYG